MIRWLTGVVLVVLLLVVGLIAASPWLAETALRRGFQQAGFADGSVVGVDIGWRRAVLEGLTVGEPPHHRIERLTVSYDPVGLLAGRIGAVEAEGVVVRARLDDDGLRLAGYEPAAQEERPAAPAALPERVVVRDGLLELETPHGPARIPFTGEIVPQGDLADVSLTVVDARLDADDLGRPRLDLDLRGVVPVVGEVRLDRFEAAGSLRFDVDRVELPAHEVAAGGGATIAFSLADGRLGASSEDAAFELAGPALPAALAAEPVQAALGEAGRPLVLDVGPLPDGWKVAITGPLALRSGPGGLQGVVALGLETDPTFAPRRLQPSSAEITLHDLVLGEVAIERARLELRLEGEPEALSGTATVEATGEGRPLPELSLAGVALSQALDFALGPSSLILRASGPGTLRVGEASWRDQLAVGELVLRPGEAPLLELDPSTGGWRAALDAGLEGLAVRAGDLAGLLLVEGRIGRLAVSAEGDGAALGSARVAIAEADLRLPEQALALAGLNTELALAAGGFVPRRAYRLRVSELRHRLDPPWFPPASVEGSWRWSGDALTFEGRLAPLAGGARLQISGRHDPAAGAGRASFNLDPLTFAPGGLQPQRLAPLLGPEVSDVGGRLDAEGEVRWDATGLDGTLSVLLEDLSLTAGPARIEGLGGVIRLDHLLPPTTPPDQRLSVARLDIGLPLEDGLVTFQLEREAVAVERLRFRFAGGTLRSAPFRVGSAATTIPVTLTAQGLDIARIFEEIALEGLSGEGTIDGTLPLTISGSEAVVTGGELRARGPGWLRYRTADPPDAFAAGGEGMELLLQALENFRYEELTISLDGRTDAEMDVGVRLRGANPALYDGYPIEFNLALEGELANILRTGLGTWRLPEQVRERMEQRPPRR